MFLDIGQWASEWNKSLAKKDKPLVQKKYRGGGGLGSSSNTLLNEIILWCIYSRV